MIECKLRPRPEFGTVLKSYKSNKKKLGRYHSSYFHDVSGYGKSKWIVLAEIDIIDKKDKITLENHQTLAKDCIEYLNQLPIKKRKTRKKQTPLYGNLELYRSYYREDKSGPHIMVMLITDQKKNKHFWGTGVAGGSRARKRKTKTTKTY